MNYSNSEFQLQKTKFNITISQLRSHHFIDIDTFNTNLFVTLYNQSVSVTNNTISKQNYCNYQYQVNENGYIIPEYDDEECIFSCAESLPWLNESTVSRLLDQHLRLTIQRCQDNKPLFDCIISFSVKERLFVVSHHLENAPLPRQNSENEHLSRKVKYDFLKKDKKQGTNQGTYHLKKTRSDQKFIFVTFGEKENPSTNRFDLNFPPTLNLVVNGMGPLKQRSELNFDSLDIFAHRKGQHLLNQENIEIDEEDTELMNLGGLDPMSDNEQEIHVEEAEGHTSHHTLEKEELEKTCNLVEKMHDSTIKEEPPSNVSHLSKLGRYFDFSQHRTAQDHSIFENSTSSSLVQPQHPSIPVITQPVTFYSHDTNETVLVTATKEKNSNLTRIHKRVPHTPKAVIDCHEPKPLTEIYNSFDNSQKLLSEHKEIFAQQQKNGALGMIDMNMYEEIRKDAPSTDAIMVGNRKLIINL